MSDRRQIQTVKYPRCGWIRSIDVTVYGDETMVTVLSTRVVDAVRYVTKRIKGLLEDPALDEANAWADMRPVPRLEKVYQYHVRNREAKP